MLHIFGGSLLLLNPNLIDVRNLLVLKNYIKPWFTLQQEGSLCAQHCLNNLLQGQYFSPVDLAEIAQQLDESEREQMAVAGLQTEEYKRFMEVVISKL